MYSLWFYIYFLFVPNLAYEDHQHFPDQTKINNWPGKLSFRFY